MLARFQLGAAAFSVAALLFAASPAHAASWQSLSYGGTMRADYYVPDRPASPPPILVSLHYCGGQASNARSWFQSYSDQYGFIIITPGAGGSCFDAAASRSGERAAVASMVAYVVMQRNADAKRVFAAGLSSGACMAHALVAAYPDVFAAGSSLAGVPAGAWNGGNNYGWSTTGVNGAQAWGDKVRNADPGYMGKWGRMQIWHGEADTNLTYSSNYPNEVAQWTNVHMLTDSDGMQTSIRPAGASNTWNRTSYSRNGIVLVEANHAAGIDHDLGSKGLWQDVIRFFELDKSQADTTYGKDTGGTGGTGGRGGMGGMSTGGAAGASAGGAGGMIGSGGMVSMTGGSAGSVAMTGGASGAIGTTGGTVGTTGGAGGTTGGTVGTTGGAGGTTGGTVGTTGGAGGTTGGTVGTTGGAGGTTGGMATSGAPDTGGDTTETEPSGCGCRLGSQSSTERSALAALGLGLLGILLRRRRSAHCVSQSGNRQAPPSYV